MYDNRLRAQNALLLLKPDGELGTRLGCFSYLLGIECSVGCSKCDHVDSNAFAVSDIACTHCGNSLTCSATSAPSYSPATVQLFGVEISHRKLSKAGEGPATLSSCHRLNMPAPKRNCAWGKKLLEPSEGGATG